PEVVEIPRPRTCARFPHSAPASSQHSRHQNLSPPPSGYPTSAALASAMPKAPFTQRPVQVGEEALQLLIDSQKSASAAEVEAAALATGALATGVVEDERQVVEKKEEEEGETKPGQELKTVEVEAALAPVAEVLAMTEPVEPAQEVMAEEVKVDEAALRPEVVAEIVEPAKEEVKGRRGYNSSSGRSYTCRSKFLSTKEDTQVEAGPAPEVVVLAEVVESAKEEGQVDEAVPAPESADIVEAVEPTKEEVAGEAEVVADDVEPAKEEKAEEVEVEEEEEVKEAALAPGIVETVKEEEAEEVKVDEAPVQEVKIAEAAPAPGSAAVAEVVESTHKKVEVIAALEAGEVVEPLKEEEAEAVAGKGAVPGAIAEVVESVEEEVVGEAKSKELVLKLKSLLRPSSLEPVKEEEVLEEAALASAVVEPLEEEKPEVAKDDEGTPAPEVLAEVAGLI
ncbi:hypothetical protein CVT26_011337, partial [Gymnopilus dilepis]